MLKKNRNVKSPSWKMIRRTVFIALKIDTLMILMPAEATRFRHKNAVNIANDRRRAILAITTIVMQVPVINQHLHHHIPKTETDTTEEAMITPLEESATRRKIDPIISAHLEMIDHALMIAHTSQTDQTGTPCQN